MTIHAVTGATFEDILQTGHVLRWHTKPMARPQTLADHLAKVALLADKLGRHLGERYDDAVAHETLLWALQHDLPETEHGDIPNPAKKWLNGRLGGPHGPTYDSQIEVSWWGDRGVSYLPDPFVFGLVKVADVVEAATQFWIYGLDHELRHQMIFEAITVCRLLLPELLIPVCEALAAAGVPQALIGEAAA